MFGPSGCIFTKVVVNEQSGCIRAKVVCFGKKWLYLGMSCCIRAYTTTFAKFHHVARKELILQNTTTFIQIQQQCPKTTTFVRIQPIYYNLFCTNKRNFSEYNYFALVQPFHPDLNHLARMQPLFHEYNHFCLNTTTFARIELL